MSIFGKIGQWFLGAARDEAAVAVRVAEAAGVTIDADDDQFRALTSDAKRDLSPLTHERMREVALYLWEQNLLGNRLIELPLAYLLAEGVHLDAGEQADQEVLDRFWNDPINQMDIKLVKKARELALYGEQCWPAFVNEVDGHVRLGYLDPSLIAKVVADPDNPEQPIGIVTVKDRKGVARRYRVIINGGEDVFSERTREIRAGFADGEAFYFAVNDLSCGMRGRSDLLAQADWIDAYDTFLIGEMERANHLRAFVWDVTLAGAGPDLVEKRAREITPPAPGSVRVHNDSETWKAETPSLNSADSSEMARLFRNHSLGGGTLPEHWFGGGGDVNRAVGAEMGEPTFKVLSMRQRTLKHVLETVGRYVLRQASMRGKGSTQGAAEPDWNDPRLEVQAIFPELTAKDTTKYAAALQQVVAACVIAVQEGYLTRNTAVQIIASIAGRLGVEFDAEDELANAEKEAAKRREDDVFKGPDGSNPGDGDIDPATGKPAAQAGTPGNMPKTRQPAGAAA